MTQELKPGLGRKVLPDIKGDLSDIEARHSTLQTRVMELQKRIKRYHLILKKADEGNTIVTIRRKWESYRCPGLRKPD